MSVEQSVHVVNLNNTELKLTEAKRENWREGRMGI